MIAKRRVDNVGSQGVGPFHSLCPIILFGGTLRLYVLTSRQEIGGVWSRTDIDMRPTDGHGRESLRSMVGGGIKMTHLWIYKITRSVDSGVAECLDAVHVHKATIHHGYEHSLSAETRLVKTCSVEHLHLPLRSTVDGLGHRVPRIERVFAVYTSGW